LERIASSALLIRRELKRDRYGKVRVEREGFKPAENAMRE